MLRAARRWRLTGSLTRGFLHFGIGLGFGTEDGSGGLRRRRFGGLGVTGAAEAPSLIVSSGGSVVIAHCGSLTLNLKKKQQLSYGKSNN